MQMIMMVLVSTFSGGEYREDDRDQHAERTPGGARAQTRGRSRSQTRRQGRKPIRDFAGTFQSYHERTSLKPRLPVTPLMRPGQREDQDGGNHGLEAVGQAIHAIPEAKDLAAEVPDDGEDDRHGGAEHEPPMPAVALPNASIRLP